MELSENNLELLLTNQFEIDCIEIKLIQQIDNEPIIYCGPGSITQKNDGNFHLKVYHSFNDIYKELIPNIGNLMPGKIIGKEKYFSMTALDMSGNKWTAVDISVPSGFSIPASGKVIESTVKTLTCQEDIDITDSKCSSFFFLLLPGKYDIPCNELEIRSNGGGSLNTCKLKIFNTEIFIKDQKNSLTIRAADPLGKIDLRFQHNLIEALSIIFGKVCNILCSKYSKNGTVNLTLNSIPKNIPNKKIASPIRHYTPYETKNFEHFIERYIDTFNDEKKIYSDIGIR